MNNAQEVLKTIRDNNEVIDHHYDERAKKTAVFITTMPFTMDRAEVLFEAMMEWLETTAAEKKIRGAESVIVCLQDALACLDEIYEPSVDELDLEARDMGIDSRITQDKEARS